MRKLARFSTLAFGAFLIVLICTTCAGGPRDKRSSDSEGNLKINNQSGVELAVYVNKRYTKTAKTGEQLTITVDNVEARGTVVDVECFYRDKVPSLESYPTNQDARYWSFPKAVMPLGHPDPIIPIHIWALSDEDLSNNVGIGAVLVKFSYNDFPRINSAVWVFTGSVSNRNTIVTLTNGEQPKFVPMPVGWNQISVEYRVDGKSISRQVYPQNENQRNDERFLVYVPSDITEMEKVIPRIGDIFNVSYVTNNPAARGTLRIRNNSSRQINIRIASGTESERPINDGDSGVQRTVPRNFPINSGNYILRAVDALDGGYREIARIEDLIVDPGMVYYWFIDDNSSIQNVMVNMTVPQQIKNWFQTWIIDSIDGVKVSLRINSTANEVQSSRRELGVTGRNGQLVLRDIDIEYLIRGLSTTNARRVNLTIIAEKEGYETASQSLSAYSLLTAGTTFRPERFNLEKIDTSMENAELIIGEPLIP